MKMTIKPIMYKTIQALAAHIKRDEQKPKRINQ